MTPLSSGKQNSPIDKTVLRIAIIGIMIVAAFVALFSRLWFLQVLAAEDYRSLAKENRVRFVHSEPPRGLILDRNGVVLVENRGSLAITVDREIVGSGTATERIVLSRLSRLTKTPVHELSRRLKDASVSPYKPVAVAYDVPKRVAFIIRDNREDFPGVATELLPIRRYPQGATAAHVLGYVGEIFEQDLELDYFKEARPAYGPGDIVGKLGIERTYDRWLRGRPEIQKKVVDSSGGVVGSSIKQEQIPGRNLTLSLDIRIQATAELALQGGLRAAQGAGYNAPTGSVVVLDPNTGGVIAMASSPSYNPEILADGITQKELNSLGAATDTPDDDVFLNRAIQAQRAPASTFKVVTAGAAMATGVASASTILDCPGSDVYPPDGGPGSVRFRNWTSLDLGLMGFPESLEQSCDTFYYELGWAMEDRFGYGTLNGDETERFQDYARTAGLGHDTGIDLPYEASGRIPDNEWCEEARAQTIDDPNPTCELHWLPGYTVNMSIGQGDVLTTPLQMAVTYAAIANGGRVVQPRLGWQLTQVDRYGVEHDRDFQTRTAATLPLDSTELGVMQEGLRKVIGGVNGTARDAFAGFPLARFPIAGKTGTSELAGDFNDAWFVGYGPAQAPEYVIAVYIEEAGHGGESAAPVARQLFEAIFGIDDSLDVQLSEDESR